LPLPLNLRIELRHIDRMVASIDLAKRAARMDQMKQSCKRILRDPEIGARIASLRRASARHTAWMNVPFKR